MAKTAPVKRRKTGRGVPIKSCKHDFPKTKQITARSRVICRRLAKSIGVKALGRRGRLGTILGRRDDPWLSATARGLASALRSNTNTMPNYRIPITAETHDAECAGTRCVRQDDDHAQRRIWRAQQRTQKTTTGYFCGYISKRQPVGKYELAQAAECQGYLRDENAERTPLRQQALVVNRALSDLEKRGTLRTAPEEFNLASRSQPGDPARAEFVRTFMSQPFCGAAYLGAYEQSDRRRLRDHMDEHAVRTGAGPMRSTAGVSTAGAGTEGETSDETTVADLRDAEPPRKRARRAAREEHTTEPVETAEQTQAAGTLPKPRREKQPLRRNLELRSLAPAVRAYGFRGTHRDLRLLSPWEFCMHWQVLQLFPPNDDRHEGHTEWMPGGQEFWQTHREDEDPPPVLPGIHYKVREVPHEDSHWGSVRSFPDHAEMPTATFRHEWIMVRHMRPRVPQPERCPMPSSSRGDKERRAQLLSLYLRPWTLARADVLEPHVPHVLELDVLHGSPGGERTRSWRGAWKQYVRGRIVSQHAMTVIRGFLSADTAQGAREDMDDDEWMEAEESRRQQDQPDAGHDLQLSTEQIQQMVDSADPHTRYGRTWLTGREATSDTARALQEVQSIFGLAVASAPDPGIVDPEAHVRTRPLDTSGQRRLATEDIRQHAGETRPKRARLSRQSAAEQGRAAGGVPVGGTEDEPPAIKALDRPAQSLFETTPQPGGDGGTPRSWLQSLQHLSVSPNPEQLAVLQAVVDRVELELQERAADTINEHEQEPLRVMVQGIPGSGKSRVIWWMRDLFEQVLGWHHGREFVCLASMNTMAALIGGNTVHSWGEVAVDKSRHQARELQTYSTPNISSMWTKLQHMRWILIDEMSTLSTELLGALDSNVTRGMSSNRSYKHRAGPPGCRLVGKQSNPYGHTRPFGGCNCVLFGDWWQLPPVRATSLVANPFLPTHSSSTQHILGMTWRHESDSFQRTIELTREVRCRDPWLSAILRQCRDGSLSDTCYCFVHGHPTLVTGTWMPGQSRPTCGQPECEAICAGRWREAVRTDVTADWSELSAQECELCQCERRRR